MSAAATASYRHGRAAIAPGQVASLRSRPGVLATIWLTRLGLAWALSLPAARVIARSGIAHQPGGDARLFEPGAVWLVELLRLESDALLAATDTLSFQLVLAGIVLLVPWTALLVSLGQDPRPGPAALAGATAARLPAMLLLSAATLAAQGVVALAGALGLAALSAAFSSLSDPAHDLLGAAWLAATFGVCLLLGVIQDLARTGVAGLGLGVLAAARLGFELLRHRTRALLLHWLVRAVSAVALVAGAAALVHAIDVSRPNFGRLALVTLVHGVVSLALVLLRADWFAVALRAAFERRAAAELHPELRNPAPADTAAGSGAPGDPSSDPAT